MGLCQRMQQHASPVKPDVTALLVCLPTTLLGLSQPLYCDVRSQRLLQPAGQESIDKNRKRDNVLWPVLSIGYQPAGLAEWR